MTLPELYDKLFAAYGPQHWWPARTPFEMMVGAVLTQNSSWQNVEKAIAQLGEERLCPEYILSAPMQELAELIRPAGYFNVKAGYLKALSAWYLAGGGEIGAFSGLPDARLRQELLGVKGVGRETCDSILLYAFNRAVFVIDNYTKRITKRLGLGLSEDYEELRLAFEAALPRDAALYNEYHALLVSHAKCYCRKIPLCSGCPLLPDCPEGLGINI